MVSTFRGIIDFFGDLGMYDVVLPFLLVFAVTFAILEKTKIFGEIQVGDDKFTRKNYNAIVAFVLGFLVVASTKVVSIINEAMANIAIIMIGFVSFMITIGVFYQDQDMFADEEFVKKYRTPIAISTLIAVILIMLNVLKTDDGTSWFMIGYNFISRYWDSNVVGSIIMLVLIAFFIRWIQKPPKKEKSGGKS